MNSAQSLVSVKSLYRRYGTLEAVRGVSFELRLGEVLGLLGPNGAGKTTTLQMLCGVLAPSAGQILIDGEDHISAATRTKRKIGYLPEQPPLYHELSVDEFLRFCARLRRVDRASVEPAVEHAKLRCGLTGVGKRLIGNLSKGFQQRVGIAQSIVHSPAVVVLDEPTVGLDPIQIREIRNLIRELGNDHAVILSTHVLPEVQAVCDRVQILHEGRVVLDEVLESVQTSGDTLRVGLRRPPAIAALEGLSQVESVECLDQGCFRIRHRPGADMAETLAQRAVAEDWGLFELAPEQGGLEEIFLSLTFGEKSEGRSRSPAATPDGGTK
jgi:ABC-2 type transport system ATP-binding protein